MFNRVRAFALGVGLILAAGTGAAVAQTPVEQIQMILTEVGKVYKKEGFTKSSADIVSSLAQGKTATHKVNLTGGRVYTFSAGCDTDCSDIDLTLYSANGRVVGADTDDTDSAVVAVPIETSGTYSLELLMAKCSEAPCAYGITTWHLVP
jgi:hypothetical protein